MLLVMTFLIKQSWSVNTTNTWVALTTMISWWSTLPLGEKLWSGVSACFGGYPWLHWYWQWISYPEALQAQFMPFSGSAAIYVERKSGCQSCRGLGRPPVPCDRLIGKHFGQRANKRRRCKVLCLHTKTNFYCGKCDAHLCEQPCFQK